VDSAENQRLSAIAKNAHIGTMGWSYSFWVGSLYPKGTASSDFLREYSRRLNSVELDNTFYRIPVEKTINEWKKQTPDDFLFSPKFPRIITHTKMLKNCEAETERFIKVISNLDEKLGPLLLQFPSNFGPEHFQSLKDSLHALPKEHRFAVELRNKQWPIEKLTSLLKEYKVALTISDRDPSSEAEVNELTAEFAYMRWEGNRSIVKGNLGRVEVDKNLEITEWAAKARKFLESDVQVFGYFSKYFSGYPPGDAEKLLGLLNSAEDRRV
jgi:uncharacterized protein YecE (DUF72 family)